MGIKLVLAFSKGNNFIYCFDSDLKKIKTLRKKNSPFSYIKNSEIKNSYKYLNLDNKLKDISKCDVVLICLPTPLKNNKPDLTHIQKSWKSIKSYVRKGQILILESTTYPGCTEDIFLKDLKINSILEIIFSYLIHQKEKILEIKNLVLKTHPKLFLE